MSNDVDDIDIVLDGPSVVAPVVTCTIGNSADLDAVIVGDEVCTEIYQMYDINMLHIDNSIQTLKILRTIETSKQV